MGRASGVSFELTKVLNLYRFAARSHEIDGKNQAREETRPGTGCAHDSTAVKGATSASQVAPTGPNSFDRAGNEIRCDEMDGETDFDGTVRFWTRIWLAATPRTTSTGPRLRRGPGGRGLGGG